jgi:hypothetical protein
MQVTGPAEVEFQMNQFGEGGKVYKKPWPFETVIAAGALSATAPKSILQNGTGATFAVTLAAPLVTQDGQVKMIKCETTMLHTITLAMTNIKQSGSTTPTGTTTLTFTNVGDCVLLVACGLKWNVIGGSAVAS